MLDGFRKIQRAAKRCDLVQRREWAAQDSNVPLVSPAKSTSMQVGDAESDAPEVGLAEVIVRWQRLPPTLAAGLLALARSSTPRVLRSGHPSLASFCVVRILSPRSGDDVRRRQSCPMGPKKRGCVCQLSIGVTGHRSNCSRPAALKRRCAGSGCPDRRSSCELDGNLGRPGRRPCTSWPETVRLGATSP